MDTVAKAKILPKQAKADSSKTQKPPTTTEVEAHAPVIQAISSPKKKNTNNKRNNTKPSSFEIVTPTSAKSASYRTIAIHNKQLENQLKYCDRITRSLMTITGSLVRCHKFDIQTEFDAYVELLLTSFTGSVQATLTEYEQKVAAYETQGYEFFESGQPAKIRVEVRSSHVANLIELIILLDRLMTTALRLEKTPAMTPPELYNLFSDWIVIPRQINGRLMSVIDILDKKFRLKVSASTNSKTTQNVEFTNVHEFMIKLREDFELTQRTDESATQAKENKASGPKPEKRGENTATKQLEETLALADVTDPADKKQIQSPVQQKVKTPEKMAENVIVGKTKSDFLNWKG